MSRNLFALLIPPVAVVKRGCATCTAAPISVFWLASLLSIGYGLLGGVRAIDGYSWPEILLGIAMWGIAAAWAHLVLQGVSEDIREGQDSSLKRRVIPHLDESDPFKHVSDAH